MVVYLDAAMILNAVVDYLLLVGTNRLCGFPPSRKRCAVAGALGGLYGGFSLVTEWTFLQNTLWRWASLGLMGVLAFGVNGSAWKRLGIFLLLSLALGGEANLLQRDPGCGIAIAGFSLIGIYGLTATGAGKRYLPLEIPFENGFVRETALLDTGNCLKDPLTGENVLIVGPESGEKLLGLSAMELADPVKVVGSSHIRGLRLIPYHAIGTKGGLLLAKSFPDVCLGKERATRMVAFSPEPIGNGVDYKALAGGM